MSTEEHYVDYLQEYHNQTQKTEQIYYCKNCKKKIFLTKSNHTIKCDKCGSTVLYKEMKENIFIYTICR